MSSEILERVSLHTGPFISGIILFLFIVALLLTALSGDQPKEPDEIEKIKPDTISV